MEAFDTCRPLVEEIGEGAVRRVFELFAGDRVSFPKKVTLFFRDLEIANRFEAGESYEKLARTFRLSSQQIRHITSRGFRSDQLQLKIELVD